MQFNGQPPGQRFCHVGSVYDSSLIIFGGYDGSSRLNDFKQFRFGDEEFELDIPESTLIGDLRALVNSEVMSDITFVGTLFYLTWLEDVVVVWCHLTVCTSMQSKASRSTRTRSCACAATTSRRC